MYDDKVPTPCRANLSLHTKKDFTEHNNNIRLFKDNIIILKSEDIETYKVTSVRTVG